MANYDLHDRVRITATFSVSDTDTDPTTVTFSYKTPAGATTSLVYGTDAEVMKSATGVYYVDLDLSTAGVWYYRWRGTGTVSAATPDAHLEVNASIFA